VSSEPHVSAEYEAAIEAHNVAYRTFAAVRAGYYAKTVNDADFLAARAAYIEATKLFDAAFAKEASC
jgi:hypothetical protein